MPEKHDLSPDELAELAVEFPLPDGVDDVVLNRSELAEFFNVAANTITTWISQGLPVEREGTNGQAYEFRASHCYAWRKAKERNDHERSAAAQSAIRAMRLALTGGKPGDSIEALSPKEKQEAIAAQLAYEQFQRARNELIDRGEVADLLEGIFSTVRDVLASLPDTMERENLIAPSDAEKVIDLCDGTLEDMRGRITRFFEIRPVKANDKQPGQTLFDA
jgi:phage terminase Nu1 subunit (DNA packaging protein)